MSNEAQNSLDKVYFLVMGECGFYSDWRTWPVRIFLDAIEAASFVAKCREWADTATAKLRANMGNLEMTQEELKNLINPYDLEKNLRKQSPYDKHIEFYEGDDDVSYHILVVSG